MKDRVRSEYKLGGSTFWLIAGASLGALILTAGFLIDRNTALQERLRVEQAVRHALQLAERALDTQLVQDIDIVSAIADDIADDAMLAPRELNRTLESVLKRNPHLRSITFGPLDDDSRMAFTPRVSSDPTSISIDIPIPPMPWQTATRWQSLRAEIDKVGFLQAAGVSHVGQQEEGSLFRYLDLVIAEDGKILYGDSKVLSEEPVSIRVTLAGAALDLYGVPSDTWEAAELRSLPARLLLLAGIVTMMIAAFGAIYLLRERNQNLVRLAIREARLADLSKRLQIALETSNTGIWEIDEATRQMVWDARTAELHERHADGSGCHDRLEDWYNAIHVDDLPLAEKLFFDCVVARSQDTWDLSYRVMQQDGVVRHLRSVGARSQDGQLTGIVCDITNDALLNQSLSKAKETSDIKNAELELALEELSAREHQLVELSQRLDIALGSYNCGTWEGDPVTKTAVWDERMHQLYGMPYSDKPVTEHQWLASLHADDRSLVVLSAKRAANLGQPLNTTQRVVLPNNETRFIRSVGQAHIDRDGKKKLIGIAFDVTADVLLAEQLRAAKAETDTRNIELELAKNRIEYNSLHDPLTSLANRRKLDMELDAIGRAAPGERQKFAILHLDLDRFKEINDTLGHAAGDTMLVHASRILTKIVPRGDLVARIGGDEFVILSRQATTTEELSKLSSRILEEMRQPIDFEGFDCRCGVSIGIAQSIGFVPDPRKLLINADIALYQAKEKGRNGFEFFTPDLQANIVARKRMADDILAGIERDEFIVHYQPQFHANSMQLCGAEALVRWRHPDRGIVATNHFLRIAEDLNVMARIDEIVLQTALKDQMRWTALGVPIPRISVNVSSRRLHDVTLVDQLQKLNLTPGTICFELVESIFLDDGDSVSAENIERIKALGIDIEIDDFGTGHTSIVSLLKLKPKRLKIDRQLVMPITSQPQERSLVRSIVEIARSLGVETVAEGVETQEHATMLRQIGCDYLQGFAFAKPLSFEDFTRFVGKLPQKKAS
ncbi:EAL domain-containing protein [Rhizobium sp. G187]|uniref:bifunctional diguanylate cyclase/phosphodiesterase n=1 Tax=Rhizobium sp. G187 TaxID=3451352 RepID=UPI003EE44087